MNGPVEAPNAASPLVVRVLSGVAGVAVFLLGCVASCGAILAAPLGVWLVRRRERRLGRRPTRIAALVGSVFASMTLAFLLWAVFFAVMPKPTTTELQSAVQAEQRKPVKLPDWYIKAFPQAARYDSASRAMVQSPTFMRVMFVASALFLGGFFGTIGGTLGWCATALVGVAWRRP